MNKHFEITTQDGIAIITPKTIEAIIKLSESYGLSTILYAAHSLIPQPFIENGIIPKKIKSYCNTWKSGF